MASKITSILTVFLLYVVLPSLDVFGDISLAVNSIQNGHPNYGIVLLFPVGLNTAFQVFAYFNFEEDKLSVWPLLILQVWPQYRALKIIFVMSKNLQLGQKMLVKFNENVALLEPYLESMPQMYIKLYMMMTFWGDQVSQFNGCRIEQIYADNCLQFQDVFGDNVDVFFLSFAISILSGVISMTKSMTVGPTRIAAKGRCKNILILILVFLSVGLIVFVRGLCLAANLLLLSISDEWINPKITNLGGFIAILGLCGPNLVLSILGIVIGTGCSRQGLQLILKHPMLLLLPLYTPFAFSRAYTHPRSRIPECLCSENPDQERNLGLSICFTFINVMIYSLQVVITLVLIALVYSNEKDIRNLISPALLIIPFIILTILFSACVSFLFFCIRCSSLPVKVLKLDNPDVVYYLKNNKLEREPEETDMAEEYDNAPSHLSNALRVFQFNALHSAR